jgi:hypothetical protein
MEEKKIHCQECEVRQEEHKESEELNFAILIALVPMLTLTLFSNVGLI